MYVPLQILKEKKNKTKHSLIRTNRAKTSIYSDYKTRDHNMSGLLKVINTKRTKETMM